MIPSREDPDRSQEIARWARAYAQNRSLGVVIALLVFAALSAAIGILSYVGGIAYRDEKTASLWICIAALLAVVATLVYMAVPKWGGRRLEALAGRFYREGKVSMSVPAQPERQRIALMMGVALSCGVFASVLLGYLGYVPPKYAQPVSAIYVVPFLFGLQILMRPAVSYVSLLWPILYGVHAILIVVGVPIVLVGPWESLNIALPIVGYGLVAALLGHACNRRAWHRLKHITRNTEIKAGPTEGAARR